ncbi:protein TASOR isoform X1 [Alosa sapidissima]|uniref:protein TASOR isoform X1 n=1 Tax=Alosa sapidissima TaxID=34773 RepID=UPI001C0A0334|nr:protein TASOR isoform X1 [Alosa sapidissima]
MEDTPRLNFQIPRKSKEKRALFQYVSSESREYTDISKIITSGYKDPSSWGSYQYTKHCLVHSELQEKEFIEKRRELKLEGRSEKEMVESYCFILCESYKLQSICDKGLHVGHSWMNMLGNPSKGVYLSKYSDLLQINPFEPGATGEIIIFKVIRGKMKSISDNMSRSLDPTPKFDSHISKNLSRVVSHRSYRAFEHTQQYFYEYADIDVRPRPRHICPYAVLTFQYKGKETAPLVKPMPPLRSNSFKSGKGKSSYVVWSGHLTNGGKEAYHVSFRSLSHPILPFKLPDKIEIGTVMHLDQVKLKIPPALFSWDLYSGSQEVFKTTTHCCLFEVVEKNKCGNSLTVLLYKLERERLVLVNAVTDRGFFFLLSSAQMANPSERRDGWKNSNLQALFVFPESRDVAKYSLKAVSTPSPRHVPQSPILPQLDTFIPALHFALNKVRGTPQANPPANPSTAVTQQVCDYLSGQREGKLLPRVHLDYDIKLDDRERLFPAPRNKLNLEAYLHSYICCPNLYYIPVSNAQDMMDSPLKPLECHTASSQESAAEGSGSNGPGVDEDPEKVKQLLKLIQAQKQQAGKGLEASPALTLKRKCEEEAAETGGKHARKSDLNNGVPREDEGLQAAPSLAEVMNLAGLCDTDLRKNKTQGALKLMEMLDNMNRTATATSTTASLDGDMETTEEGDDQTNETLEESMLKLGLPINCDTDLRKQPVDKEDPEETDFFEDESVGSMSSLEAFSPCSDHGHQRGTNVLGEKSIPWVLIPITGIKPGGYSQRQWDNPQDPRLLHTTADSHETPQEKEKGPVTASEPVASSKEPPQSVMEEPLREPVEESPKDDLNGERDQDPEDEVSEEKNLTDELKSSHCQEQRILQQSVVDSIVDEQLNDFSAGMMSLLKRKHVSYRVPPAPLPPPSQLRTPMRPFSDYVARHHAPVPLYGFVRTLRNSLTSYIDSHLRVSVPELPAQASLALNTTHPSSPESTFYSDPASVSSASVCKSSTSIPTRLCGSALPSLHAQSSPRPHTNHLSPNQPCKQSQKSPPRLGTCKETQDLDPWLLRKSKWRPDEQDAEEVNSASCTRASTPPLPDISPEKFHAESSPTHGNATGSSVAEPSPSSLTNVINQLNPEMFSNLVEIIKGVRKNSVLFYIHSSDGEESEVCTDIKEYLLRLGNAECNPQLFLEKNCDADKLLIIIRNEDIASEVHKIPALVKLKKLPFVSFAGVDSLDDIQNHTYNELFVSGGFIVSDEFVLNPDFTAKETLQKLLEFLQQLNSPESPWRWKVHCKTLKRLREQSRVKADALGLLNLLTAYQKRHVVEFLPYHECDAPSNSSTDLACLVKLQAQHTLHRHVIFLTERPFEMFQHYASSGILIAAIDDVLKNFKQLIEFNDRQPEVPVLETQLHHTTSSVPVPQHKEGRLAVVSEEESLVGTKSTLHGAIDQKHFAPSDSSQPTPDQLVPDGGNSLSQPSRFPAVSQELDFDALRTAITQFKAAKASKDRTSQGPFNVNTHQSFLGVGLPPASCLNTLERDDSPTSSLTLNVRQTSDNQVESSLQLHPTHHSLSQKGLRLSQQVQETTETTLSSDSTTPTSLSHTDMTCSDSSFRLESAMVINTSSCDDVVCRGQNLSELPIFPQSETVSSVPSDYMLASTSETSGTTFLGSNKMSDSNHCGPNHLDSNSGTVPNPPSVEDVENALKVKSVPTRSENTVSKTAYKHQLVEPPIPSFHSTQPETPSVHGANAITVYPVPNLTTASFSKESTTGLQAAGVWSGPQGPITMSNPGHGLHTTATDPMTAMMLQHVTFGNSLGGVVPQGGLLPMTSMPVAPMPWSGYPRGSGPVSMWGMQQNLQLRQMHQTQFIQGFTWRSDFPGQGNSYRPFGGGL